MRSPSHFRQILCGLLFAAVPGPTPPARAQDAATPAAAAPHSATVRLQEAREANAQGVAAFRRGDTAAAIALFREAVAKAPNERAYQANLRNAEKARTTPGKPPPPAPAPAPKAGPAARRSVESAPPPTVSREEMARRTDARDRAISSAAASLEARFGTLAPTVELPADAVSGVGPDSEEFRRGRQALQEKNWELAATLLDAVQRGTPGDPATLLGLAVAAQNRQRLLPALAWYEAFLRTPEGPHHAFARAEVSGLEAIVRGRIDALFDEAAKIAVAAGWPRNAGPRFDPADPLIVIARQQISAGLPDAAATTLARTKSLGLFTPDLGEPRNLGEAALLALARAGGGRELDRALAAFDTGGNRGYQLRKEEIGQLGLLYRFVLTAGPDFCGAQARGLATDAILADPAKRCRDILAVEPEIVPSLLADTAGRLGRALLRLQALRRTENERQLPEFFTKTIWWWCTGEIAEMPSLQDFTPHHLDVFAHAVVRHPQVEALRYCPKGGTRSTPLWSLAWSSTTDIGRRFRDSLERAGYTPNSADSLGQTPLHDACQASNLEALQQMLTHGGNARTANRRGWTPLHTLANNLADDPEAARLLLKAGADVTARTSDDRRTPLHLAALGGSVQEIAVYLEAGADRQAVDAAGRTPLDLARQANRPDAIAALLGEAPKG